MVTLNSTKHDVPQPLVDAITARLHARLLRVKNDTRLEIDARSVVAEMVRLYPSINTKTWYKDYVMQFCTTRGIPVQMEFL